MAREAGEPGAIARAIVDSNRYMVLGTADAEGVPWVTPVWYAAAGYREFLWVSAPEARHSRNVAARPQVSIVVFDSQVPIGTGQGVYMSAVAEELVGSEIDPGIGVFSRRSVAQGGRPWARADVTPPAPHRLYRVTVSEHWVLDPGARADRRVVADVGGE